MILSIKQLSVRSRERTLIHDVSLSVQKGEWFALVGQSGSGKSLLSQAIGQMLPPNLQADGQILFQRQDLLKLPSSQARSIRGRRLSYTFQDYQGSFTPFRTLGQHFDEYQKAHGEASTGVRKKQTIEALQSVGLEEHLLSRYPFQLSGGQLQRASIAIALLLSPDLLIADEVTTALDSVSGHRILQLLADKQRQTGCAILFITHDWRHVRRYAQRIAVMKEGEIVESGSRHHILDQPQHDYTRQLIQAAPVLPVPKNTLSAGLMEVEQ
ncbi:ABC transporter ATP-binding protein [Paenibacillus sp. P96]|uniref:ABC transporter ATP-binding protein n=1 Tax=Paenibacillus zeirhizosphaerae TaxID=2987519 RepID=A0ABT9FU76_9BACL|nr:ABC transporter ATP-binding protein [Paenibacillus sp. P96]MDP4098263.1 ABC transporter ATP-binding protein [Paenibacillus sp. P96]